MIGSQKSARTCCVVKVASTKRPGQTKRVARPRAPAPVSEGELGLRERHKRDKLDRIANATISLFARDGYEGATLRDIAKEADIALGTLALYAADKRDLIILLFNKLIPQLLEKGRARPKQNASLVPNLIAFFEPYYEAYAKNVTLYRIILGQIFTSPVSAHAEKYELNRSLVVDAISELISRARANGECRSGPDLGLQARSFFYIYFGAVRFWLGQPRPQLTEGLAELRKMFELHLEGLKT
jgi:AcrR family transcriptional regulator